MATDGERDTSRTAVRTYVPAYQKEAWGEHADKLDMSRSEFVRTMVQAGRRGFDDFHDTGAATQNGDSAPSNVTQAPTDAAGGDSTPDPQGATPKDDLETRVLEQLAGECLDWDELFEAVTDDIEESLEAALNDLQDQNRVQYNGRKGGYVIVE
ncbi:DUF5805 domain-containing protein [Halobacteriales archaeon Cl-PHB]